MHLIPHLPADLPVAPAASPPPAYVPVNPVYNWTGFYLGGNLGWGLEPRQLFYSLGNNFGALNKANFLGGSQLGFNYEFANGFLAGVEADFDWAPNTNNTSAAAGGVTVTVNNSWLTTFTGRLGYAWDRFLVYGKGGFAWVGSSNPTTTNVATGASFSPSTSNNNYGWTLGAGVEWAFADNWSARLEYDYVWLNGQTFTTPVAIAGAIPAGDQFTGNNRSVQMINLGVNYKFGPS